METRKINGSVNFGTKLDTYKVLEVTSQKILQSNGTDGIRDVINALNAKPVKAVGCRGYKYYADIIGKKILEKYPDIAEVSNKINEIAARNPDISKNDLREKVRPLIDKLGQVVDITI